MKNRAMKVADRGVSATSFKKSFLLGLKLRICIPLVVSTFPNSLFVFEKVYEGKSSSILAIMNNLAGLSTRLQLHIPTAAIADSLDGKHSFLNDYSTPHERKTMEYKRSTHIPFLHVHFNFLFFLVFYVCMLSHATHL